VRRLLLRRARAGAVREVVLVTRQGCTMCLQAQPVVERVAARAAARLTVLDVDSDPALAEHSDHVPVVLVDGVVHSRWWVDEKVLARALR